MGPLSRLVAAVLFSASAALTAAAHGGHGHGQHVHVLPAGSPGSDTAVDGGICSGSARVAPPPVVSGPPLDLRKTPIPKEFRPVWTNAGFRIDDVAARLNGADGRPVPDGEYHRLLQPFDAAAEKIEAMQWVTLMTQGIRLDEKTCYLLDGERQVTLLEIAAMKPEEKKALELMGLSSLRAALRGLPPDQPMPPKVADRVKAAHAAGSTVPQSVLDAIAAGAPAGKILASTERTYASLTRYFDGQRDVESLVRSALPVVPGWNKPAKPRALVGSLEEQVAAKLSEDLSARFATHTAGLEMLERFRDKDGQVRLPAVRVLKLSQRPDDPGYGLAAAIQDPSNGTVVLNHWVTARIVIAAAPHERRAALSAELGEASKLNELLLKDPAVRAQVLRGMELVIAHEFVHSWQSRRSAFDVEMMRRNLPGTNPLEKEQEAYREQYRYFHSLLKAYPIAAVSSGDLAGYRSALADYAALRAQVTQIYTGNFAGSSDFKTVAASQEDRRSLAETLRNEGPIEWARQGLKLLGLKHGDAALSAAVNEDARRAADFRDNELPRMQKESRPLLLSAYAVSERSDLALIESVGAAKKPEELGAPRADMDRYLKETVARLSAANDHVHDRVRAIVSAETYLRLTAQPAPKGLEAAKRRDYALLTEAWLRSAEKAPNADARRHAFEAAMSYAAGTQDAALMTRVRAARDKKK